MPAEVIVVDSPNHLAKKGAEIFMAAAKECIAEKRRFSVAVSGGSTPRAMHGLLAEDPFRSDALWEKTHVFWVDERCVPQDSAASNYGAAKKDFLEQVSIPPGQVHPMPSEALPEEGAAAYQTKLKAFFALNKGGLPVFDLIFLGIGKDGHTASLFPGQPSLDEKEKLVVAIRGGEPDVSRLTMTYPVLNWAERTVFMVSGKEKALVTKAVLGKESLPLPAQRIKPANGKLIWLLDAGAASLL